MASEEVLNNGILLTYSAAEVKQMFDEDKVVLIDVRTPIEYAYEHIKGALLSPLACFDVRHLPTQTDKPIIFHCGSGVRSKMVAGKFLAAGHARVAHMDGGFGAWKQAGYTYLTTNPMTGDLVSRADKPAMAA